jgi:hypothetical protein
MTAEPEILVVSSCTGRKARSVGDPERVPAGDVYTGDQHRRLMAGISEYRRASEPAGPLRLSIVSAGLGLVGERQPIQSYDVSFAGLGRREIDERAAMLRIPAAVAAELEQRRRLTILALGSDYLRACDLHAIRAVNGPVLALVGRSSASGLPAKFFAMMLDVRDTRRFGAGFVGLKGAVVSQILAALVREPTLVRDPARLAETARRHQM